MKKINKPSTLPIWNPDTSTSDEIDAIINCNIHAYINTSIIVLLCLFNLIFFSTHWDNTVSLQQSTVNINKNLKINNNDYKFSIKHQKAGEWMLYPIQNSKLKIESLMGYILCCFHKTAIKTELQCDFKTRLEYENNTLLIAVHSDRVLENVLCHIKI